MTIGMYFAKVGLLHSRLYLMSGHNKWSKIAGKKGIADAKRSAVFTRLAKAITLAAREGGGDVAMNFKLRMAVEQAKAANMPSNNVDRAVKRGTGEGDGGSMEAGLYEAYGPRGVGITVETPSDNKNRTVAEVQATMKRAGATPAAQGSVLFNFDHKAIVTVLNPTTNDRGTLELILIDAGADDIELETEGLTVAGPVEKFQSLVEAIEAAGLKPNEAGLEFVPKVSVNLIDEEREKTEKIVQALEDLDDVQAVYTSLES